LSIQGNWDRRSFLSRRAFLGLGGMSAAAVLLGTGAVTSNRALAQPIFRDNPFKLGVASGDPLPDSVVLWTRLAPEPLAEDGRGGMPPENFGVRYEVAEDERFRKIVRRGAVEATPELGHSVHAEVPGLRPGREYFYRFKIGKEVSPVGRTKTAPAVGAALGAMSFAFASCQAYADGYYTAYRHMAEEDLDVVVHLGDYIYEGPAQGIIGRGHLQLRRPSLLPTTGYAMGSTRVTPISGRPTRRSPGSPPSMTTRWRTTGPMRPRRWTPSRTRTPGSSSSAGPTLSRLTTSTCL
jgi:hypothetical protein